MEGVDGKAGVTYSSAMPMATPSKSQLQRALALAEKIHALEQELTSILGAAVEGGTEGGNGQNPQPKRGGKRTFSAATKARMAVAQQARWAKKQDSGKAAAPSLAAAAKPAKGAKKKRVLSPEGRARIVAAVKARHAAQKKRR
jgi:hypothetical protein